MAIWDPKWWVEATTDGMFTVSWNFKYKKRNLGEGVPQTKNEHGSNQKQRLNQHMVEI